jgi:hypothetical protein
MTTTATATRAGSTDSDDDTALTIAGGVLGSIIGNNAAPPQSRSRHGVRHDHWRRVGHAIGSQTATTVIATGAPLRRPARLRETASSAPELIAVVLARTSSAVTPSEIDQATARRSARGTPPGR